MAWGTRWSAAAGALFIAVVVAGCELDDSDDSNGSTATTEPSDWWKCPTRLGGGWNFGRIPYGCDVEEFGDAEVVRTDFSPYIFDDEVADRSGERSRYVDELYGYLKEGAADYLSSRREASAEEVEAWRHAVYATAHQETFWTHYRKGSEENDRMLTMIRGDHGHGHGLMQIDDRWHTEAIENGKGWHLDENLTYALDIYYREWQQAPDEWCVGSPTNWKERARAAYSAYNGGPTQHCRWTDPNDTWAQNDQGYLEKYEQRTWLDYVSN